MTRETNSIEALLESIRQFNEEYNSLRGRDSSQKLHPPASEAKISKLQKVLSISLPTDYLAFLRLHNGWENFRADYSLLSVEQMIVEGEMSRKCADLKELQDQGEETADHDGIIFLAGLYGSFCAYFDRFTHTADGSMEVVQWEPGGVIRRHPSFTEYLKSYNGTQQRVVEKERKRLRS